MNQPSLNQPFLNGRIDEITSCWSEIIDPLKFVYRYSPAIRAYLIAIVGDENDADDIVQEFLLNFLKKGFSSKQIKRGRFRDYLKVCVRNAAATYYRKRPKRISSLDEATLASLESEGTPLSIASNEWNESWRQCVLDKAWRALDAHQQAHAGNLFYSVLKMAAEHPKLSSERLAELVQEMSGQELSPDAYRKQLSRARRMFARETVREVSATVDGSNSEIVREELQQLGLDSYVRDYLD